MLTVTNHHYIRESFDSDYPSIFGQKPPEFKKQLELLKNQGDFIAPVELTKDIDSVLKSKENLILITFDDGLKEQFELALPILDEKQIPAAFFANSLNSQQKKVTAVHKIHLLRSVLAPAAFLEKIKKVSPVALSQPEKDRARDIYRFDEPKSAELKFLLNFKISFDIQQIIIDAIFTDFFDEAAIFSALYMNDEQLVFLARKGFLGSHTHNHLPIGLLQEKEIRFELGHSKGYFENLANSSIDLVSYPYGTEESATEQVSEIAKSTGYKVGFTTKKGVNLQGQDHLLLNRFDCNDVMGGKNYR